GDVEAFNAARQIWQREGFLQCLLNGASIGLHYAESLIIELFCVVGGEVDERAFVSTRWNRDVDPCGTPSFASQLFREHFFECLAVFEIDRNVDVARDVRLSDVKLGKKR